MRSYTQIVRDRIRPHLGDARLDRLTPALVAHWQHELRKAKGARTCAPAHAVLRACLSRAGKLDLLARNVATQVTSALAIGLRQGEALGLQWNDVDLDGASVVVRQHLQRIKREGDVRASLQLVPVKTRSGARTVLLLAFAVDALTRTS